MTAFRLEVKALMQIKPKPNLVTAAAAFSYQKKYHLLSRWADGGNLATFWKTQTPRQDHKFICWFCQQCCGLADGLDGIHNSEMAVTEIDALQSTPARTSVSSAGSDTNEKNVGQVYGRHGDIKPQNILWFKQDPNNYELGVLKITDFGVTAFHTAQTTKVMAREVQVTLTYAAPEYDMVTDDAFISRPFDIWSLGCLYLEFIIWILLGDQSVEAFAKERQMEKGIRRVRFKQDTFYAIKHRPYLFWRGEYAIVKKTVILVSFPPHFGHNLPRISINRATVTYVPNLTKCHLTVD